MPGGAFAPQQPPPGCQQLLTDREEVGKHGKALQTAGQKKAPPEELCKLFKAFLTAETKMIKSLQDNSATCGVPPDVLKQVKDGHSKASDVRQESVRRRGARAAPRRPQSERCARRNADGAGSLELDQEGAVDLRYARPEVR